MINPISKRHVASIRAPSTLPGYGGWKPCMEWCEERFSRGWWYIGEGVFEFNSEQDRTMFLLRWA
jgi:hypothetical protein